MKAIIIDPSAIPAIYEHEVKSSDLLKELQGLVGGLIEMHRINENHCLFVDEEWNLKAKPKFKGRFKIHVPCSTIKNGVSFDAFDGFTFGGRGVILGTKGSKNKDVTMELMEVSSAVTIMKEAK